jgi:hypothetical protein
VNCSNELSAPDRTRKYKGELEIMGNGPFAAVVIAAIWIVLFLIFRAIVLWYWRINEGIALLKSIDEKLARIVANTPQSSGPYIR